MGQNQPSRPASLLFSPPLFPPPHLGRPDPPQRPASSPLSTPVPLTRRAHTPCRRLPPPRAAAPRTARCCATLPRTRPQPRAVPPGRVNRRRTAALHPPSPLCVASNPLPSLCGGGIRQHHAVQPRRPERGCALDIGAPAPRPTAHCSLMSSSWPPLPLLYFPLALCS